jgi:acetylornithine/succinyldiaminopimelate/putrescine aminotransferase
MNTQKKDSKFLGRDVSPIPLQIVKSDGSYLYDNKGKKYIDFLMGWCVGNIGWGSKDVYRELKKFSGPEYVNPHYLYKPWAELAELLAKITPGNLKKSFRATGGTEAVEIALQAAMSHTKRSKFVSIEGSYHGHSIGAMSVGSSEFREQYKNLLPGCYKIKPPLDEKAARKVEKILSKREVAAFIAEPIICNLVVEIPTKKFWDIVSKACKKYGTLLIADEVATGFGRTGKLFASEHYKLKPDIMCLAKGVSGGYGGIGATIMTSRVAKSMEYDFSVYSTFGWNPLNVCTTLASIKVLLKNKAKYLQNAKKLGKYFEDRLSTMKFGSAADVRVNGLAIGLEFKKAGYAQELTKRCRDRGLLFADFDPTKITIFPAVNIDMKTAKKGLDIIEQSL